jgi:hypothetical protein
VPSLIELLYCETGFKVNAVTRSMEMSECGIGTENIEVKKRG